MVYIGFYEDLEAWNFGTISKKGIKKPLSNFSFQFTHKIIALDTSSTDFLVPEHVDYDRPRLVCCAISMHAIIHV